MICLSRVALYVCYLLWLVHDTRATNDRALQEDVSCIKGFLVYNATSNTTTALKRSTVSPTFGPGRILLDTYPQRRINILVDLTPSCVATTNCVRLTLGDFQSTDQTSAPYALYGDEDGTPLAVRPVKTSFQDLKAWTFTSADCSGNYSATKSVSVQLVPKTDKVYELRFLNATFNGVTAARATQRDVDALVNYTCDFVAKSVYNGILAKSTVGMDKYLCWQPEKTKKVTYTPPFTITYRFIARISVRPETSIYSNPDLFSVKYFNDFIRGRFTGTTFWITDGTQLNMTGWVTDLLPATNAFKNFANISIVG